MIRRRKGYALIEVLVVLTILAVMLGLSAGMIHLLLKLDRAGRAASEIAADLTRLARDFREDAHASSLEIPAGRTPERLTLAIAGGKTAEYQVRPTNILRTIREGDKVSHFEIYRRPLRASVRLDVTSEGSRPFALLMIDRSSDGQDDSLYRDYRIEAELAKDHRLTPRLE